MAQTSQSGSVNTDRAPLRFRSLVFGLLCLLAPWHVATALDPAKAISQYVRSTWGTDEGLPNSLVIRILQTRDGYLWVGTQAGLARFDGIRFTVFNHINTPVLHSDWILDLVEDRQGTLWIATQNGGIVSFREGRFNHLEAIDARGAFALAADPDGSMWIAGYGGVKHLTNGVVGKTYTTADGVSGDPVGQLRMDKEGALWIGTTAGLDRLTNGRIRTFTTRDGLPNNNITGIHSLADGSLWVSTANSSLVRFGKDRFVPSEGALSSRAINDLLKDRDGNLWLASGTEGLLRLNGQHLNRSTSEDNESLDAMYCVYEDREGNIWAGSIGSGLHRYRDGSFTTYAKEEGLSADATWGVIEDKTGDIWITTAGGLNRLHENVLAPYGRVDPVSYAWSLLEDNESNLLAGTAAGALLRLSGERLVPMLSDRDGIPPYHLSAIIQDRRDHDLWMATRGGGLVRYRQGSATVYSIADGMLAKNLYALSQSRDGTIWIGTQNGLNSIRDGRISHYPAIRSLRNAVVASLYVDHKDILWIGTLGRGLIRLEKGQVTQYTVQQGLIDDAINSILEDGDNNLWVGSDKGVFRLNRRELDEVAAGRTQAVQALGFGKADGMKSAATNGGTQPNAWRARDGRLWFPTSRGVSVIDPMRLSLESRPPSARIEEMVADQHLVDLLGPMQFVPGTRRLEIRYTAPSLSDPQRTLFRYRLEGFDSDWIPGGAQRLAQYTNLSPGHYTFRVNARMETGDWNPREAVIGFDLMPSFYQTNWFRLLCSIGLVSILWGVYRLRINWLHAKAAVLEERQRIARDIHDSLAQSLSAIMFQTQAGVLSLVKAPRMTLTHLNSAHELAKSSLKEARNSVWDLSAPMTDQKSLAESLSSMAKQLARGRINELEIHSSGTAWVMRPAANHHIVMIAQEAMSNSIHHGQAAKISIVLEYFTDSLFLSVKDDGVGFASADYAHQVGRGYGMQNIRHRAERLGARLDVASTPSGTAISLHVPKLGRVKRLLRRILWKPNPGDAG